MHGAAASVRSATSEVTVDLQRRRQHRQRRGRRRQRYSSGAAGGGGSGGNGRASIVTGAHQRLKRLGVIAERSKPLDRSQGSHRRHWPTASSIQQYNNQSHHLDKEQNHNCATECDPSTTTDLIHQRQSHVDSINCQSNENSRTHLSSATGFGGGLRINSSYWVVFNTCCAQLVAGGFSLNVETSGGVGENSFGTRRNPDPAEDSADKIPEYYQRTHFDPQQQQQQQQYRHHHGPAVATEQDVDSDADAEDEQESEEIDTGTESDSGTEEVEEDEVEELISSNSLSSSPPCPSITPPPLPSLFPFPSSKTSFDTPPHMRRCRDSDSDSPPSASHHIASTNTAAATATVATAAAARSGNVAPVLTASRTGAGGAGAAWYATDTGTQFCSVQPHCVRSIHHTECRRELKYK